MPDGSLHPITLYVVGFFIGILTIVVPLLCVLLL